MLLSLSLSFYGIITKTNVGDLFNYAVSSWVFGVGLMLIGYYVGNILPGG